MTYSIDFVISAVFTSALVTHKPRSVVLQRQRLLMVPSPENSITFRTVVHLIFVGVVNFGVAVGFVCMRVRASVCVCVRARARPRLRMRVCAVSYTHLTLPTIDDV